MKFITKPSFILYSILFFIIEAILIVYLYKTGQAFTKITPDGQLYFNIAENLVNGNGMINDVRREEIIVPPLFSLILAPFALVGGESAYFIFQYIMYGVNGILLFMLARLLFNQPITALVCTLLYAIHPVLLLNGPQYLLTETLFITFILLVMYASIRFIREEIKTKWFLYTVVLLSLSLLFRPHLLYVFILIGLVWLFFVWKKSIPFKSVFVFLIPVLLLVANGVHNLYVHKEFALLENYSGQNLYIANNPNTKVAFYASTIINDFVEPEYFEYRELSLSERSAILKEEALDYILAHPIETIKRSILKVGLFFKGIYLIDWVTLGIALLGIMMSLKKEQKNRLELIYTLLFILGFAALTSAGLLVGGQRYRAPIIPVYLLFSGYTVVFFISLFKRQETI